MKWFLNDNNRTSFPKIVHEMVFLKENRTSFPKNST